MGRHFHRRHVFFTDGYDAMLSSSALLRVFPSSFSMLPSSTTRSRAKKHVKRLLKGAKKRRTRRQRRRRRRHESVDGVREKTPETEGNEGHSERIHRVLPRRSFSSDDNGEFIHIRRVQHRFYGRVSRTRSREEFHRLRRREQRVQGEQIRRRGAHHRTNTRRVRDVVRATGPVFGRFSRG